jgi:hypothetical protein
LSQNISIFAIFCPIFKILTLTPEPGELDDGLLVVRNVEVSAVFPGRVLLVGVAEVVLALEPVFPAFARVSTSSAWFRRPNG